MSKLDVFLSFSAKIIKILFLIRSFSVFFKTFHTKTVELLQFMRELYSEAKDNAKLSNKKEKEVLRKIKIIKMVFKEVVSDTSPLETMPNLGSHLVDLVSGIHDKTKQIFFGQNNFVFIRCF